MNKIEFGEVHLGSIATNHLLDCINTNQITCGPKVKLFEEKWKQLFNYKYCTAVNSGTSAVLAACMSLVWDNDYRDEIICPALSFIATANAIRAAGFKPVFVDVRREDLQINVELVEKAITTKTRAIVAVNLMGKPCQLDVLAHLCQKYNILLIVDNAEAYGCRYKGKLSLGYATFETSSHYVAHLILGCEMGTVNTRYSDLNDRILSIRSHGRQPGSLYFDHPLFGLNLKPSDLHASIALEGVDKFWETFQTRHINLYTIQNRLDKLREYAYFVEEDHGDINCPHGFSVVVKPEYSEYFPLMKAILDKNLIHWKRNFGSMPTQQGCFSYLGHKLGQFPEAEYVGDCGLHIGCHQYLSPQDIDRIVESFKKWIRYTKIGVHNVEQTQQYYCKD
jgi:dTDP-4-amino-4,6-dideoxygalactose transaminase